MYNWNFLEDKGISLFIWDREDYDWDTGGYSYTVELGEHDKHIADYDFKIFPCKIIEGEKSTHTLFIDVTEVGGERLAAGIVSPESEPVRRDIEKLYDKGPDLHVDAFFTLIYGGDPVIPIDLYDPTDRFSEMGRVCLEDGRWIGDLPGFEKLKEKSKRYAAAQEAVKTKKKKKKKKKLEEKIDAYLNGTDASGKVTLDDLEKAADLLFDGKKSVEDLEEKREKAVTSRKRKQAATMAHTSLSYYDEMALKSKQDGNIDIVEVLEECVTKITDMLGTIKKMLDEE